MIETKIWKVGNSTGMTLTTEMLTLLDAKEGARFSSCGAMMAA